jgi:antitoxin (DNA-binding transcriptional repressor) of toxin-antitoxin stability system
MIGSSMTVHMTEAEVARDLNAVLEKVQQGVEVVIEQDHRPVAVIKPSTTVGRPISEVVADLKARGSNAVIDDDFARDIQAGIDAHREPWNPTSWD